MKNTGSEKLNFDLQDYSKYENLVINNLYSEFEDLGPRRVYQALTFLNGIKIIKEQYPKIHIAVFNDPHHTGERSEVEQFFGSIGNWNVLNSVLSGKYRNDNDRVMIEKARNLIYKVQGFDDEYVDCVINFSYFRLNSTKVWRFSDYNSKYINVVNGRRVTTDIPQNFTGTVYFFGASVVSGLRNGDSETIESYLQRMLNENNIPLAVQNCSNTFGFLYDRMFRLIDTMRIYDNDILVFSVDSYVIPQKTLESGCYNKYFKFVSTNDLFTRPHDHGELFVDTHHPNSTGNRLIAERLFEELNHEGYFEDSKTSSAQHGTEESELSAFLETLLPFKKDGKNGAIVMNCNPFTLGHRYLIEKAVSKVDNLYIFVVEEDKSEFKFADRIELVRKGTADLPNVTVLPSGKFIISALTFQQYFEKGEKQDITVDASLDVTIFGRDIAKVLGITVRFAGEEPLDNVTRQYNATMKQILPQHGVEFCEIPRKEADRGGVISASRVRKLLEEKKFEEITKIVPETTLIYLKNNYMKEKGEIYGK